MPDVPSKRPAPTPSEAAAQRAGSADHDRRESVPPRNDPERPWRAEGVPDRPKKAGGGFGGWRPRRNTSLFWLPLLVVFGLSYVSMHYTGQQDKVSVPYTAFTQQVQAGNVKDVYTKGYQIQGKLKSAQQVPGQKD